MIANCILLLGGYCSLNQVYTPQAPQLSQTVSIVNVTRAVSRAVVKVEGLVYAIGGRDSYSGTSIANVEAFEPISNETEIMSSLRVPRYAHSAVYLNKQIMVCGGWSDEIGEQENSPVLDSCESYDLATNEWSLRKSLPNARYHHAVAVLKDRMYVFGGWNGDPTKGGFYNDMLIYNPFKDSWSTGPAMLTSRSSLSALTIDGHILVCGGYRDYSIESEVSMASCEIFSPYTTSWRPLMQLAADRLQPQLIQFQSRIYFFGAFNYRSDTVSPPELIDVRLNQSALLNEQPLANECVGYTALALEDSKTGRRRYTE